MTADPGQAFPPGFFDRADDWADARFYDRPRFVTHIDDAAIAAVSEIYAALGIDGSALRPTRVLDLMSSWVSHFRTAPAELVVLGLNAAELDANTAATSRLVQDLNVEPTLPFDDASFDAVTCCVSIDYLTRPVQVLREVARVLRPDAPVVITFSDRCFPTKAIRGWLATDDDGHIAIVRAYLHAAGGYTQPEVWHPATSPGADPLAAVVGRRQRDWQPASG